MRKVHCDDCGKLVASLESGSKIQKGAIMLCNKCSCKNDSVDNDDMGFANSIFGDGDVLGKMRSMWKEM